jgi:hypothetical protein
LFAQLPVDNLVGLPGLVWVVLQQIAQDDIHVQTNHRQWRFVAPASIAMFISSTVIGRLSLDAAFEP